jgi:hypothetical protein
MLKKIAPLMYPNSPKLIDLFKKVLAMLWLAGRLKIHPIVRFDT